MTVYIDDMFKAPMGQFGRMKMSRMMADNDDELHAMADLIGVDRQQFQRTPSGDHYDISKGKRALAIEAAPSRSRSTRCPPLLGTSAQGAPASRRPKLWPSCARRRGN